MIVPDQLKLVVEDLGHFVPRLAFTGGLVLGLYLERQPMFRIFPTKDADAVVACTTHADYISLQLELGQVQARPLAGDGDAPICRMVTSSGQLLDLMPADESVLVLGNAWFPLGYETAQSFDIGASQPIRIFPPPVNEAGAFSHEIPAAIRRQQAHMIAGSEQYTKRIMLRGFEQVSGNPRPNPLTD
jgi:hypothetical protein